MERMVDIDYLDTVIHQLGVITGPARNIDGRLALLVGFRKVQRAGNVFWVYSDDQETRVPAYTADLDAAFHFAQVILPDNVGAFAFDNNTYRAQFWDGPVCYGANPAIAICRAALSRRRQMEITDATG